MTFSEQLKEKKTEAEQIIFGFLPEEEGQQKIMFRAMNYSVENGGKRLRPILMRESYRFFGGGEAAEKTILAPFMAAIEMIHSYSLVHDDLPAMDNDRYRRGKLTTHAKFGEDMGILAGDALLNYAYETALTAAAEAKPEESVRVLKALRVLANKAGVFGMVGGQTVDVKLTGKPLTMKQLDFIYELKTGCLLEASLMVGAILAGASDEEVKKIEQVASDVGMAFQIKDDILDETSTTKKLGKPVHSDLENGKTTYVTKKGLAKSECEVERLTDRAVELLDSFGRGDSFLRELLLSLVKREM